MKTKLTRNLEKIAQARTFPDGTAYTGISLSRINVLAQDFHLSKREIEISALALDIVPERYARNMKSLSTLDQKTLLESCVTIVGTGGLGGTVAETLARMGIGALNLIDGDRFEESNLNRQLFSTEDLIDKPKAVAAADRIKKINSTVQVTYHSCNLNADNACRLIDGSDVTVDCLDNIPTRFTLQKASQLAGIPMVSAAVGGQSGHLTTIFPEDRGLEMIFGNPEEAVDLKGAEKTLGNLPFAVSTVASLECAEIVKILLQKDTLLRNRLIIIDLNDYTFETLRLV